MLENSEFLPEDVQYEIEHGKRAPVELRTTGETSKIGIDRFSGHFTSRTSTTASTQFWYTAYLSKFVNIYALVTNLKNCFKQKIFLKNYFFNKHVSHVFLRTTKTTRN